ncbi:hypothetical protein [Chromobacterium violaceum]|uniref:hypothetical protein n=1 Tax=Chromobacterium violaceum TaxID=536 RepID=UPI00111C55EB|nr:hypothetical protein [Chromobacterium violaceum]
MSAAYKDELSSFRSNWWEVYIIRYSLGTLVGSLMSWFLIFQLNQKSIFRIFISSKESAVNYVVIAFMGLTFCYVASAPMLVAHASRYQERRKILQRMRNGNSLMVFLVWCALAFFVLCALGYFDGKFNWGQFRIIVALLFVMGVLIWTQVALLPKSSIDTDDIFVFYDKLSLLRHYTFTDIMMSYRHLREHGNAYALLIFELLLGLTLFLSIKVHIYLAPVVILAWVLPAAYSWQVGSNIEKKYIEVYYERAARKHEHVISKEKSKSV